MVFTIVFHRSKMCPSSMHWLIIMMMACMMFRCFWCNSSVSSECFLCGPLAYSALYRPKCLPDGDVDVVSLQDLILPANSVSSILFGMMSRSDAVRQVSRNAWQCGMLLVYVPDKILSLVAVVAAQSICSESGGSVNGVPWAWPKCPWFRSCM